VSKLWTPALTRQSHWCNVLLRMCAPSVIPQKLLLQCLGSSPRWVACALPALLPFIFNATSRASAFEILVPDLVLCALIAAWRVAVNHCYFVNTLPCLSVPPGGWPTKGGDHTNEGAAHGDREAEQGAWSKQKGGNWK